MALPVFLLNGLIALGFRVLHEHINSDDDTSEVEDKIIKAKSSKEVKAVVAEELLHTIDDQILTDTDIPEDVVTGLAKANNKEEIVEVLNTAEGQKSFINAMGTLIKSIASLLFR